MTITFKNDNDIIVYTLEKVISYARRTQHIFVAECVWWLASIIGLEQGLITHIDSLRSRLNVTITQEKIPSIPRAVSSTPRDNQENQRQDKVLKECEEFQRESRRLRDITALKSKGTTRSGRINPTPITMGKLREANQNKKASNKKDQSQRIQTKPKDYSKTEGIDEAEVQRRKAAGECLRCAWPSDCTGTHRVKDCIRPIKLDEGMANYPKSKEYQKIKQQQPTVEEDSSEDTSSEDSSDDSL
jgi:hypothetical protein